MPHPLMKLAMIIVSRVFWSLKAPDALSMVLKVAFVGFIRCNFFSMTVFEVVQPCTSVRVIITSKNTLSRELPFDETSLVARSVLICEMPDPMESIFLELPIV